MEPLCSALDTDARCHQIPLSQSFPASLLNLKFPFPAFMIANQHLNEISLLNWVTGTDSPTRSLITRLMRIDNILMFPPCLERFLFQTKSADWLQPTLPSLKFLKGLDDFAAPSQSWNHWSLQACTLQNNWKLECKLNMHLSAPAPVSGNLYSCLSESLGIKRSHLAPCSMLCNKHLSLTSQVQ